MHYPFSPVLVASFIGMLFMQHATAQVYQCLDASGKKIFSQLPCAAQGGNGEKLVMRAPAAAAPAAAVPADGQPVKLLPGVLYGNGNSGGATAPKNWAAENAAANARAASAEASSAASRQAMPTGLRKSTPSSGGASDKQIVANCEANHGARCNSAGEIAQRRMEQRELTASERQEQQRAVADRLERQRDEALSRSMRR